MISVKTKDFLRYAIAYIIVWVLAVYFIYFIRFFGIEERLHLSAPLNIDLNDRFFDTTIIGIMLGIMFILSDFILRNKWFKNHNYILNILLAIVVHGVTFAFTIFFYAFYLDSENQSIPIGEMISAIWSTSFFTTYIYFFIVIIMLNVERYVRKIFGPGVMFDIIRGKYYKPRNEERFFLFLDLINSTTYAENLGSLKFTELIQDCFHDVSAIVKKHEAEIYQYVGDEVILMWVPKRGKNKNNAFNAYFSFQQLLERKKEYYLSRYGSTPKFKGGLHYGVASVGEVGDIKKEIAYLGDAVNVAARLLDKCNQYQKYFLASKEVVDLAVEDVDLSFDFVEEVVLKGKKTPTKVFSISRKKTIS